MLNAASHLLLYSSCLACSVLWFIHVYHLKKAIKKATTKKKTNKKTNKAKKQTKQPTKRTVLCLLGGGCGGCGGRLWLLQGHTAVTAADGTVLALASEYGAGIIR